MRDENRGRSPRVVYGKNHHDHGRDVILSRLVKRVADNPIQKNWTMFEAAMRDNAKYIFHRVVEGV